MAEEYDVQAIMNALKEKEEMDPDQHDGCYELMRETIEAYGKSNDFSVLDFKDLNLVYLTTVGTWKQGIDSKKKTVSDSHLMSEDKEYLTMLWDKVWEKAGRAEYTNYELDAAGDRSIGMFGIGFFSFQRTTTSAHAQAFVKMCVNILPMNDDTEIFDCAAWVLTKSLKGMKKSFTTFSGGHNARALLFPMEKVFESYIAQQLKKVLLNLDWDVSTQDKGYYLFDSPRQFALRPDIVITREDGSKVILDTKWKSLFDKPRLNYGISQADMYQMYTYSKKYETSEIWLLYPVNLEMRDYPDISFDSNDGVNTRLFFVDVANIEKSLLKLRRLLGK